MIVKQEMLDTYEKIWNDLENAAINLREAAEKLDYSLSINNSGYNANNIYSVRNTIYDVKNDVNDEIIPAINKMWG